MLVGRSSRGLLQVQAVSSGSSPKRPNSGAARRGIRLTPRELRSQTAEKKDEVPATTVEAPTAPPVEATKVDPDPLLDDTVHKSRVKAVAAKISAARELARRLAEEKQAAMAAAKKLPQETAERLKKSTEDASAIAAAEAARADEMARKLKKAETGKEQLNKLKAENEALKDLLLELASDRRAAEQRLMELQGSINVVLSGREAGQVARSATATDLHTPAPTAVAYSAAPVRPKPAAAVTRPTREQLMTAAAEASNMGLSMFIWPKEAVPVGQRAYIYYNRKSGPIPLQCRLQVKAGLNKWEEIVYVDLEKCADLSALQSLGCEWWEGTLELPSSLFRVDFVIQDMVSGVVDNNNAKDFHLRLVGGPSEAEFYEQRALEYDRAEEERLRIIDIEEQRIAQEVKEMAQAAAQKAREATRARREQELRQAAQAVIAERRKPALRALQATDAKPGVFAWAGGAPKAGNRAFLAYNCQSSLSFTSSIRLHVGFDGWYNKQKQIVEMFPIKGDELTKYGIKDPTKGQWFGGWVDVPCSAAVLNFVFSDREERAWDNNGGKDYHSPVQGAAGGEQLVEMVYQAMKSDSSVPDLAREAAAGKRAIMKFEMKAEAEKKRRAARYQFLYTIPLQPKAGQPVEVFYNPDLTALRGRPEIFMRGSFNRWRHSNALGPVKMTRALPGGIGFMKATIQTPADAHVLDLVFSDSGDLHGGFYDNNGGLDYHVPIVGATGVMPGLKVAHVAVEMAPIAKVGGMGDVVTALGRAVKEEGHTVEVVVPKYDIINYNQVQELRQEGQFQYNNVNVRVWKGLVEGLPTTFLEPENGNFWVGCIYGRNDDHVRFGFFCGAALEYLKRYNVKPDIVHCHDWQSAPIAWGDRFPAKAVFTIHNLNYGADMVARAMAAAEVATTVSPTYAKEISGHQAIAPHLGKLFGIRNGIDQELWDPESDPFLPVKYSWDTVVEGKAAARAEMRKRMNLAQVDVPVVGCVTRLVHQKGIHLIKHAAWRTLERGGQFVLLGSAPDGRVQAEFNALKEQLAQQYPDRACLWFAYDEPLAHLIYAGCDMFLVPSMFEPCGLTQMIAMRYGTVPVVRKTGGLNDTVFDVDHDEERAAAAGYETNGFSFDGTDAPGMDYALNRALSSWYSRRNWWNELSSRIMKQDWSWSSPALDYVELYYKAMKA